MALRRQSEGKKLRNIEETEFRITTCTLLEIFRCHCPIRRFPPKVHLFSFVDLLSFDHYKNFPALIVYNILLISDFNDYVTDLLVNTNYYFKGQETFIFHPTGINDFVYLIYLRPCDRIFYNWRIIRKVAHSFQFILTNSY